VPGTSVSAWKAAQEDPPDAHWSEPFSMASDHKISKMDFPAHKFDDKVAARVDRLANSTA
jgi:hypothetical protein